MRSKFALPIAALFFVLLLVPRAALAATADCPTEPATGTPIALGEVFAGTNCNLYTDGDVDSFVFSGTKGDTYQLALAINDPTSTSANICLTIYDPSSVRIFSGCTVNDYPDSETWSVVIDQKLTVTGTYTMDVTEASNATTNYAVSLERLYPFPADAQTVTVGKVTPGDIASPTASNAFTFTGATTGTYEVSATVPAAISTPNLCLIVYAPGGAMVGTGPICTVNDYPNYEDWTAVIDFTPSQDGTYLAFLYVQGNDTTVGYNLEVSCLTGSCTTTPPPPKCALKDSATYNATTGTVTMKFTIGTPVAATWNGWLTDQSTMQSLWSVAQPITEPGVAVTMTQTSVAKSGKVGILSTLTTATGGITCSSWTLVNTGKP